MTPSNNPANTASRNPAVVVPGTMSPDERESLITRVVDTILGRHFGGGYDFFISYAWKDGRTYAIRLRDELKQRGFRSFLDSEDYEKGTNWKREGRRALKRTNRLLLVVTAGALNSDPVKREINLFHSLGRPVWPINIANVWESVTAAEIREKITAEILRFEEVGIAEELLIRGPSDAVLHDIAKSFDLRRQNEKRSFWLGVSSIVFLILSIAACGLAWIANIQRDRADTNAETAKNNEQAAIKLAEYANEQRDLAVGSLQEMIIDVQVELAKVPAAQDVKRRIIENAIKKLQNVGPPLQGADSTRGVLTVASLGQLGDIMIEYGNVQYARDIFESARSVAQQTLSQHPNDVRGLRGLAVVEIKLGEVSLLEGRSSTAEQHFQVCRTTLANLLAEHPNDPNSRSLLTTCLGRLAEIARLSGDSVTARRHLEDNIAQYRTLVKELPKEAELSLNLSLAHSQLAAVCLEMHDVSAAESHAKEALRISEDLAAVDRGNVRLQFHLANCVGHIADVLYERREFDLAKQSYLKAFEIVSARARVDGRNRTALRNKCGFGTKLGNVALAVADLDNAEKYYNEAAMIALELTRIAEGSAQARRDLAVCLSSLGDVAVAKRTPKDATAKYEQAIKILQGMIDDGIAVEQSQQELQQLQVKISRINK